MYNQYQSAYLHSCYPDVPPQLFTRCVTRAHRKKEGFGEPTCPFVRELTPEEVQIDIPKYDFTRRDLGFGVTALIKLRRHLHSQDPDVSLKAVTTIGELVRDSTYAITALNLKIPDRLADLLYKEDPFLLERVCFAYMNFSNHLNGKMAIVTNELVMNRFKEIVVFEPKIEIRIKVAECLERLANMPKSADFIIENGFLENILNAIVLEIDPIVIIHLRTLQYLMYGIGQNQSLEQGFLDVMILLLRSSNNSLILIATLGCLMMMLSNNLGKHIAHDINIFPILETMLNNDDPRVYTAAAGVLMFATIMTRSKVRAIGLPRLKERLERLLKTNTNIELRRYCTECLANLKEGKEEKIIFEEKKEEVEEEGEATEIPCRGNTDGRFRFLNSLIDQY